MFNMPEPFERRFTQLGEIWELNSWWAHGQLNE